MNKKFALILLSVILVTCLLFGTACGINNVLSQSSTASATASASSQGNKIYWNFDAENGKLVITGTGNMPDYSITYSPWRQYIANIKSVEISDSVTSIGDWAFSGCTSLRDVNYNGDWASWNMIAFGNATSNPLYYGATLHTNR